VRPNPARCWSPGTCGTRPPLELSAPRFAGRAEPRAHAPKDSTRNAGGFAKGFSIFLLCQERDGENPRRAIGGSSFFRGGLAGRANAPADESRGIGSNGAWLLIREFFGRRQIRTVALRRSDYRADLDTIRPTGQTHIHCCGWLNRRVGSHPSVQINPAPGALHGEFETEFLIARQT
jgi:hypothetical protein